MAWSHCIVITIMSGTMLAGPGELGQEDLNVRCTDKKDVLCDIFRYNSSTRCDPQELAVTFPSLFTLRYDKKEQYWPGAPASFRRKKSTVSRESILQWRPPGDSSIAELRGFLIQATVTSEHKSEQRFCYIIAFNTSSPLSIRNVFTITLPTVRTSSTYFYRLHCLPLPDPIHEKNIPGLYSKTLSVNTNNDSSSLSAADWLSNVTCSFYITGGLNVTFALPPRNFQLNIFDVTLRYKTPQETKDIKQERWRLVDTILDNEFYSTRLLWNSTQFENENIGMYEIGITPVDIYTFQGCLCRDALGQCVGLCKTSLCTVSSRIQHEDTLTHLKSQGMAKVIVEEEMDMRVYISIPSVLIVSIVLAVVLFVSNKHWQFTNIFKRRSESHYDERQTSECNNRRTESKDQSIEPMINLLVISPVDVKNSDMISMSLSDQMVELNEIYLQKIRYESVTTDDVETISLGGKSV